MRRTTRPTALLHRERTRSTGRPGRPEAACTYVRAAIASKLRPIGLTGLDWTGLLFHLADGCCSAIAIAEEEATRSELIADKLIRINRIYWTFSLNAGWSADPAGPVGWPIRPACSARQAGGAGIHVWSALRVGSEKEKEKEKIHD